MLLQQFQQHLKNNFSQLSTNNCKLLLAVSGGIDSVVMTDLFYKSGFDFSIAHCNFKLRGEESDRDEAFVRSLALKYNKQVFTTQFDTEFYADENKLSIQEAARKLRYSWFAEVVESLKLKVESEETIFNYIVIAHNADDNIETLLLFLFRGTGLSGLTGITAFDKERKIIRPLLFASRNDIAAYAKQNNINWVEDSSNATDKYKRNFLRHQIIPLIEKEFPNAKQNLLEDIERLKDAYILYNQSIELQKKKLIELKGNEVHVPILKLKNAKALNAIIWEIIKDYNFHAQQVEEIKKLFNADNSKYVSSASHRVIKNRNWLIISPNKTEEADFILIDENTSEINFKNGNLRFEKLSTVKAQLSTLSSIVQLDAKQIEFPLILRKWKQGDYFYPLGMRKKKKLSRFFIDQKLSATEKENIWLLESNKKILWIINHRIDERFKITPATNTILKININR